MKEAKNELLLLAKKVQKNLPLKPEEVNSLLAFNPQTEDSTVVRYLKELAFPLALCAGFMFVVFSEWFAQLTRELPPWTNMSTQLLAGVDYLWDFIGEPIGQENIIYHLPNMVMYAFGFFGIKKIIDVVEKKSWLDTVLSAQAQVKMCVDSGSMSFRMRKDHSILFVGKGDFVAEQFFLDHPADEVITVAESRPSYTSTWVCYDLCTLYDDLKKVLFLADAESAGEYLFFPVQDHHLFLPNDNAFDVAPHKLDILIQNIREIEKEKKWVQNRIVIVGDAYHHSRVQTVNEHTTVRGSEEIISLESITKKHEKTHLVDPTDLVIDKIIELAKGREITFRATKEGLVEYRERFYQRLKKHGYAPTKKTGMLVVGYDIFEDLTEQQTLIKNKDYLPVILSKQVKDAVERNGYKKHEYIYVPDLVLEALKKLTR